MLETMKPWKLSLAITFALLSLQGCEGDVERQIRQRAADGDAQAQLALGKIYLVGSERTAQDNAEAELLLKAAAAQGISEANYLLGSYYLSSSVNRRDEGLAALEAAARAGHLRSQTDLGIQLGPVNLDRSIEWLSTAAHAGYEPAFLTLAIAHEKRGAPEDLELAYAWMSLAAEKSPGLREHGMTSLAARLTPAQLEQAKLIARAKRSDLRGSK